MKQRLAACIAFIALALLLTDTRALAASLQDGPYVVAADGGGWVARWVEGDDRAPKVREERVSLGTDVQIASVGDVPAFEVKLRKSSGVVEDTVAVPEGAQIFVMADTHGELEIAVELLVQQKVIDTDLNWSFGKGRLVVLGDVFDRGPHQTEILWLLYGLEAQAGKAGGAVYLLLGNHESMALEGDERYLNPRYLKVRDALGVSSYAQLWGENTLLGAWLRTRAAVMKVGDFICLHGGISPDVVERGLSLAQMNQSVRSSLGERQPDGFVMSPNGPLWYRGYFAEAARRSGSRLATPADVAGILKFYDARAVLVGHTIVPTVTPLYDGKVIAVQVYPHLDNASGKPLMEGLLIQGGAMFRARIDGSLEAL